MKDFTRFRGGRGVRRVKGEMNSLERAYSVELDARKAAGEIAEWYFDSVTLTIANPPNAKVARLTPDFAVYLHDYTMEFHECKGFMEGDALIKLKAAASQYPHKFLLITKLAKKNGGGFAVTEF